MICGRPSGLICALFCSTSTLVANQCETFPLRPSAEHEAGHAASSVYEVFRMTRQRIDSAYY